MERTPSGCPNDEDQLSAITANLDDHFIGPRLRKFTRLLLAVCSSIPWLGGFLSAAAAWDSEKDQTRVNELHRLWLKEHKEKLDKMLQAVAEIIERLEGLGEEIQERIESPEFLALVKRGFRSWDQADTDEKRKLIGTLLSNAGASKLCHDDLIRLFIDWIDRYHEAHFRVIRKIYNNPGVTRGQIWDSISDERPQEDSAAADLFKLLVRDLSAGGVIRQFRPTDGKGRFWKNQTKGPSTARSSYMKSAFDDREPYELTELGRQFVHYSMNEVVPRIGTEGEDQ